MPHAALRPSTPGHRVRAVLALLAGLCAVGALGASAGPAGAASTPRPIVYVVVVDGLDGDRLDAGAAPFLRSLIQGQGGRTQYFRESRSVMVAETNPNHVAMLTGAYADRSGVPGNAFALYRRLEGEADGEADRCRPSGPEQPDRLPTVTSGENADCLLSETIFQAVDRQGDPDDVVTAGVFGKAKLGRLFAARRASGAFHADSLWAPCSRGARGVELEYCAQVPVDPITGDRTLTDSVVMDRVLRDMDEGVGPRRQRPDLSVVNLPAVDNAGHVFGAGKPTYDTSIGLADREIQRLVTRLRERGEWERSVVMVVSDHAHDDTPQATTITTALTGAGISADDFVVVQNGNLDMVYLADRTSPGRFELLRRMRAAAGRAPNVDEVLYREDNPADGGRANTLDGRHPDWAMAGERTGDLVVFGRPGMRFSDPGALSNPLPGNHGNWHTRDNTFLVTGGGAAVRPGVREGRPGVRFDDTAANPDQAENVDVASTVAGAFGLFSTLENRGRFLGEALDPAALPGGGVPRVAVGLRVTRQGRSSKTRRRYRFAWGIEGGRWDLELERRDPRTKRLAFRKVYRDLNLRSKRERLLPGRGYRVRVRAISAAGVRGAWETRRFTARG